MILKLSKVRLPATVIATLTATAAQAAEIIKAPNADSLELASSWLGNVVPSASDIAVFDSSFSSGGADVGLNASIAFQGLRISGNTGNISLAPTGSVPTLTLGSSGLDLSNATSGSKFTIQAATLAVPAATVSQWTLGNSVTFHHQGNLTFGAGTLLKINVGSGAKILADALTGNLPAIYGNDLASVITENVVDEFGNPVIDEFTGLPVTQKRMVPSVQNTNNPANPAPDATTLSPVPTNTGGVFMDFRTQYASDGTTPLQGISVPNGWFFSGFRFSVPNVRTDGVEQWTINYGTSGRTITPGIGVIVTDGVGTDNVVFTGNGWFRIDNTNRLILHQDNPSGDLIFRNSGGINARTAANAHIVKSGRGRVIIENGIGANNGLYLYEGTMQIGAGGTAGALGTGPVINNGSLIMNRSDAVSLASVISGSGDVTQAGAGTLTLSGANSYRGVTNFNAGTVSVNHASALGTSALNFNGGTLTYASGITTDISVKDDGAGGSTSRSVALGAAGGTINTGGNNITLSGTIGQGGAGALTKSGAGVLTLASANTYTGGTTVGSGTLQVTNTSGSATGTGGVTVASGGILSGTGTVSGNVTVPTGGKISPGVGGVGNLTVGGLTLASGSLVDLDFASTSSYDRVVVSGAGALAVNGGGLTLTNTSNASAWSTPGTYNLFQYSGSIQGGGASSLSVLNPQAGFSYTFGSSSGFITLNIAQDAIITGWSATGSGSWGSPGNWSNGVPSAGYTAEFAGAIIAPATVTLDGDRTVNGVVFNSAQGYALTQGTGGVGSLFLSKTSGSVAVNVVSGSHTISAPVVFSSTAAISTAASTSLTLSNTVSGAGGLIKTGDGAVDLTAHNTFSGNVSVLGGLLGFSHADSLGSGNITFNGGTLRYNAGNTADISGKAVTIEVNGAMIDTNGNNVAFAAPIGNGGAGKLTKLGAGTLSLTNGNTFSGGLLVSGGILSLTGANTLGGLNTIGMGTLAIDGDAALGVASSGIVIDPGSGNDGTLQITGTDVVIGSGRTVTLSSGRGLIDVGSGNTTISAPLAGSGILVKKGAGRLTLGANASSGTNGTTVIDEGSLTAARPAALPSGGQGIVLTNASLNFTANEGYSVGSLTVNGSNTVLSASVGGGTFGIGTIVGGSGSLTVGSQNWVTDFTGAWTGFNGTIVLGGPGGNFRFNGAAGSADVTLDAGVRGVSVRNSATAITLGALTGQAGSSLSGSGGGVTQNVVYTIGGKNLSTAFAGAINNGAGTTGLTKVGTGTLTLTGASNYTGATTVNVGTLQVDGSLATTPVSVSSGGTLAGSGTIGGTVVLNGGALRPGGVASGNPQLTVTGALWLGVDVATAGTTQFDFTGATFTGVKADGGITYAGTLGLNFSGSVYNGAYTLFQVTGGATGGFVGVSAVSAATTTPVSFTESTETPGLWTGTIDGASLNFNTSTGVLTVTGGASAVTPGVSTLSSTAGNAKVDLSWTSASGADTYTVKRSTTQGGPYTNLIANLVGATYSDTTVTNGTTYYYVVQAKNSSSNLSGANSNEVSATPVAGPAHTALQTWRFDQFGVYDDDSNVLAGDTEDFDGDGLANLLEYALGTNPTVPNASPITVAKSGNFLTLTYPRLSPADAALTYTVQGSNDLAGGFTTAGGATDTVGSTSTYTDNVNVSTSGVRRFLRLSVSYTAP